MSVKRLLVVVWSMALGTAWGQQDPQFTQYMFNTIYYNPAAAGIDGITRFTALHRSQWLGYQSSFDEGGAPTTQLITASAPIYKINSGVGGYILRDAAGPFNTLEAQVTFAYHRVIKGTKVSAGVKAGMYAQTLDYGEYRVIQPGDPLVPEGKIGKESQVKPDMAFGVMVQREKFYAGVSLNHLTRAQFDFNITEQRGRLEPHLYVTGGYFYDINLDLKLQFATLVKTDLVKTSFDVGALAYLRDTMWGGLSFRQGEGPTVLLGYSFLKDKSLRAGYAVDVVVAGREAKAATSHEFMVSYALPASPVAGKKIVRTPRYRH